MNFHDARLLTALSRLTFSPIVMKKPLLLSALIALLFTPALSADVLELKNGTVLNGSFSGGTAATVRFTTTDGMQVIETSQIIALTFTGGGAPAAAAPAPAAAPMAAAAPAPAAAPAAMTVPAGTTLNFRTSQVLTTDQAKTGDKFTGRLESDLVVDGVVVASRNAPVYGTVTKAERARRVRGQSVLVITLSEIMINGQMQKIATSSIGQEGERSGKSVVRGAAAGAAIGGIADGSDGAKDGAGWGAVAGGLKRGQAIYIPSNTLLQFTTSAAFQLPVAN